MNDKVFWHSQKQFNEQCKIALLMLRFEKYAVNVNNRNEKKWI